MPEAGNMDIHRCRFVPYQPHCINALAFSHASNTKETSPKTLRLALGRANGDIEIWNPRSGNWFQETILRGGKNKGVESLLWTQDILAEDDLPEGSSRAGKLRLFSTSNSPVVTEWNLATGAPVRHANSNFADIWCITPQPRLKAKDVEASNGSSQLLAAGCGDGTIVLFTTEDNDLRYLQSLGKPPTKTPKVLSITWRDANTVVAGYDDSSIRIYDIRSRTNLRTLTLGKPAEGNETYVWCVRCLPDGTILSGDSSGEVKIWDPKNYSLVQRLKTHQTHIMDITANAKGDMFVSVGVDRRTVLYQPMAQDSRKRQRWTEVMHRRFHQHDVKTVTAYESKDLSVIVSGGVDTVPVIVPLKKWQRENHRSLSHLPQKSQMSASGKSRLFITWWECEVFIWSLRNSDHFQSSSLPSNDDHNYDAVATLALKGEESIGAAQISRDGNFVLVSTATSTKLFQLRNTSEDGVIVVRTRKVDLPPAISNFGARAVSFSPNGGWLCVIRMDNVTCLLKLLIPSSTKDKAIVLDRVVKLHRKPRPAAKTEGVLGTYLQTINCVAFSAGSRILAVGDLSGAVDVWLLEGHEDTTQEFTTDTKMRSDDSSDESSDNDSDDDDEDFGDNRVIIHGQRWIRNPRGPNLPRLNSAILALEFHPSTSPNVTGDANGTVTVHPTRHNPNPVAQELPTADDRLVAITSEHQIVEFEVLRSRMSDWSRRNPSSLLPQDFAVLKDRAMGCFWDVKADPTLWIYGPTWLFMLDMSQDVPAPRIRGRLGDHDVLEPVTNSETKRKRKLAAMEGKIKRNTGAGDEIRVTEIQAGLGKQVQKFSAGGNGEREIIQLERPPTPGSDCEELMSGESPTLAIMRREDVGGNRDYLPNGDAEPISNGHEKGIRDEEELKALVPTSTKERGWWITFDYRYVFGAAPIGDVSAGDAHTADKNLEVVIIERPMFDVELPPRYDGRQDWDR